MEFVLGYLAFVLLSGTGIYASIVRDDKNRAKRRRNKILDQLERIDEQSDPKFFNELSTKAVTLDKEMRTAWIRPAIEAVAVIAPEKVDRKAAAISDLKYRHMLDVARVNVMDNGLKAIESQVINRMEELGVNPTEYFDETVVHGVRERRAALEGKVL